jgi:hypothetical protein
VHLKSRKAEGGAVHVPEGVVVFYDEHCGARCHGGMIRD